MFFGQTEKYFLKTTVFFGFLKLCDYIKYRFQFLLLWSTLKGVLLDEAISFTDTSGENYETHRRFCAPHCGDVWSYIR